MTTQPLLIPLKPEPDRVPFSELLDYAATLKAEGKVASVVTVKQNHYEIVTVKRPVETNT